MAKGMQYYAGTETLTTITVDEKERALLLDLLALVGGLPEWGDTESVTSALHGE